MLVGGPSATALRVTNLQLSFTGLEFETGQQSIEGFFSAHPSTSAPSSGSASEDRKRKRDKNDGIDVNTADEAKISGDFHLKISFACTRCGQQIESALQEEQDTEAATARLQLLVTACLLGPVLLADRDVMNREHEDFHTAQDLYRSESKKISFSSQKDLRPNVESTSKRLKSSTARPGGIGQYFRPAKS
jgi:transposase-like protein